MKKTAILLAMAAMATMSADLAAQPATVIPQPFRGEWNMEMADCGSSRNDSVLRLESRTVKYFDSAGPLRAVVTRGRDIALVAELSGEGETRLHVAQFRLSRDGRTLTDLLTEPALVRYRCKARRR
jgi:hypothetical protein